MGIEWIPETCLACDNETPAGAAYCSQTCRMSDTDRSSCASSNSSPKSASSYGTSNYSGGFYLPPAYNFPQYSSSRSTQSSSYSSSAATYSSASSRSRSSMHSSGFRSSQSRSSLSSGPSHFSQPESPSLSDKAAQELKNYANSFDQVRDLKRRMSTV